MKRLVIPFLATLLLAALTIPATAPAAETAMISVEQLKQMLDQPEVVVIDARVKKDYDSAEKIISGAKRENPDAVDKWAPEYDPGKTYVLY